MPARDEAGKGGVEADHVLLCDAVRSAGALALDFFRKDIKSWHKAKNDPVTEADIAVNDLLADALKAARPDYGWLSEETEDDAARLDKSHVWIVDPIDGTRAFIRGKPHFCVSAALAVDGRPAAAALFNPATDEFFDAMAEGGARLNGSAISVSATGKIDGCRMAGDPNLFGHPAWPEPWPEMHYIQRISIAYRLALVACGAADAAMTLAGKNDWDLAAADLIVREAGGRVSAHNGQSFVYNKAFTKHRSVLAAGPALYDAFFARVGRLDLP